MGFPTLDEMVETFEDNPLLGFDEGSDRLLNMELDQVYDAYVSVVQDKFSTPKLQKAGWAKLLLILANGGFASTLEFHDRLLKVVDKENKPTIGPEISKIISKMASSTPSYSHQRLSRSIPDQVYRVIKASGKMTAWGTKNGMRLHDFGFSFPAARFCTLTRADQHDLLALSAASHVALSTAVQDSISTALPAAMIQMQQLPSPPSQNMLAPNSVSL